MLLTKSFDQALLLAAGLPLLSAAQHVIDLSGKGWTVKNAQGNVSAAASLPSQVHLDLYAANITSEFSPTRELNDHCQD
jgi:hypothetical protein